MAAAPQPVNISHIYILHMNAQNNPESKLHSGKTYLQVLFVAKSPITMKKFHEIYEASKIKHNKKEK